MATLDALNSLETAARMGRFTGYGPLPIPHQLDLEPTSVVDALVNSSCTQSEPISFTALVAQILMAFAERQATLAVRTSSEHSLERSFLALGLAGAVYSERREVLAVLPLPWRSAQLLSLNPDVELNRAARQLPEAGREMLLAFAGRTPENQSLECMGYVEGSDGDGFRYVRKW